MQLRPGKRPPKPKTQKPRQEINTAFLNQVRLLAGHGMQGEKLAAFFRYSKNYWTAFVGKHPEIQRAMEEGRAQAESKVIKTAYEMAKSGKFPVMTIFWLKCRAHWKEAQFADPDNAEEKYPDVL